MYLLPDAHLLALAYVLTYLESPLSVLADVLPDELQHLCVLLGNPRRLSASSVILLNLSIDFRDPQVRVRFHALAKVTDTDVVEDLDQTVKLELG